MGGRLEVVVFVGDGSVGGEDSSEKFSTNVVCC